VTQPAPFSKPTEAFDREKFNAILLKNWPWVILIVVTTNLAAYLTLRWTKDKFKSESEIKLDTKSTATDLGITTLIQDQDNIDQLSGEIEQIRSQVFLQHVIDSLDLGVSYYSVGKVLDDEMYRRSPFLVSTEGSITLYDRPVYLKFTAAGFIVSFNTSESAKAGNFDVPFDFHGTRLIISQNPQGVKNNDNAYYFTIHSNAWLHRFISKNLMVEPVNFSAKTIRISFVDHNALKASTIVNTIDSLYLQYSNDQKNLASTQKIQWLNHELNDIERKMGGYETYFEDFTIQNKSSDLSADLKIIINRINKIDSQRYWLSRHQQDLNTIIESMSQNKFKPSRQALSFLPDYVVKRFDVLTEKNIALDKVALTHSESTFTFQQKQQEITALKDQVFNDLLDLRKALANRERELETQKKNLEKTFVSIPDKNTQLSKNQRYYKLYEQFYLSLMQSKAEFEIAQAGSTPDFRILSPATVPSVPISPKRPAILAVGFVAGLAICFFFLGFTYLLNNKITSVKEIENALDIPVLGMLPANPQAGKIPFYIVEHPKSRLSEAVRNLRSNLDFVTAAQKRKVLSISSTISGEGKSFLAQNLATVLALTKKKVILLDLDLRKPKKSLPFEAKQKDKGISTILIQKDNWRDCVAATHVDGLHYLPNGPLPPNPAELLMNGEFESLLNELKEHYDFIVMDTPPAGLVTDGVMALKRSDLSIYVFRCNYSRKENLATLNRLIQINKLTNIAVVFNDFIPPKDNGYGYYVEEKKTKKLFTFGK
jgi:tyrosine-protein kinase Etk/Wzc